VADDPADLLARYRRLTPRQQTLVRYLADAASRTEIAEALGISLSLVDKETAEVMRAFALQEEGLTRTQRCVELRRMYLQIRRLERSEAPPAEPVAPAGGEPVTAPPSMPPPPIPASEPATAERPTPLVLLPPPIPTPPASFSAWRWWPLAAAVLVLAIGIGVWRSAQARSLEHDTLANLTATATTTTESTPDVAVVVPATTPTVAPAPTMTPRPPAPTPAPTATATVNPAVTPLDLAGKVASTLPGTPLRLGQAVTSVVDQGAKPRDMYAVTLRAGQTFTVQVTAAGSGFSVLMGAPGTFPSYAAASFSTTILCSFQEPCTKAVPVAADGAYPLLIQAGGPALRYTLLATAR